jgi:tellurium resistance protein TerD
MVVNLLKGGNVSLEKTAPGVKKFGVGLGWDARSTDGKPFDLDASVFVLKGGKVRGDEDFVFYNNLQHVSGAVIHKGDNRTGDGDGDDETIDVDLSKMPADVDEIAIVVTIDQAVDRGQNFGQVSNSVVRVYDQANPSVNLVMYELGEDFSTETAIIVGKIYRKNGGEWKFGAVGQGFAGGLGPLAANYGVSV